MDVPRCHSPFALPGHIPTDLSKGLFEGDCGEGRVAIILESTKKQVRNADVKAFGGSKRHPSCRSKLYSKNAGKWHWMNEAPRETIELDLHLTFQCRKLVTKNSASMEYTDLWDTSTTPSPILQIFFPKNKGQKKNPWGLHNPPNMHPQSCRNHQQCPSEFAEISGSTSRPGFRPQLLWPHCEADCLLHQICVHLDDQIMGRPKTWNHSSSNHARMESCGKLQASDSRFNPTISYLVDKFIALHERIVTRNAQFSESHDRKCLQGLEPVSNLQAFHSLRASFHFIMHSNAFSSGMEMYWKTMTKHD